MGLEPVTSTASVQYYYIERQSPDDHFQFVLYAKLNRSKMPAVVLRRVKTSEFVIVPQVEFEEMWNLVERRNPR